MLIRYKAQCFYCLKWFEKGQAYLHRVNGSWKCNCFECHDKRKELKGIKIIRRK